MNALSGAPSHWLLIPHPFKDAVIILDGDRAKENVTNDLFILESKKGKQPFTIRAQSVYDICLLRLTECLYIDRTNCVNLLENFFSDFNVLHLAEYYFARIPYKLGWIVISARFRVWCCGETATGKASGRSFGSGGTFHQTR